MHLPRPCHSAHPKGLDLSLYLSPLLGILTQKGWTPTLVLRTCYLAASYFYFVLGGEWGTESPSVTQAAV